MNIAESLKLRWNKLLSSYSIPSSVGDVVFNNLVKHYNSPKRHYHNLHHLSALFESSDQFQHEIEDREIIHFAIWFHDVIYKATSSDNEEKSAEFAKEAMQTFKIPEQKISKVIDMILATKNHMGVSLANNDTKLFLDFDLKILGVPQQEYKTYMNQIRKEYKMIPSLLYNPGRKKVLKKFLEADYIFKTSYFRTHFEKQARANIHFEITML